MELMRDWGFLLTDYPSINSISNIILCGGHHWMCVESSMMFNYEHLQIGKEISRSYHTSE